MREVIDTKTLVEILIDHQEETSTYFDHWEFDMAQVLIRHLTPEQLHDILEEVSQKIYEEYQCPFCKEKYLPLNERLDEWQEYHDKECLVMRIEDSEKHKKLERLCL